VGALRAFTRFAIRPSIFEEPIEQGQDISDWARAYRLGAGMMIPIGFPAKGQLEFRLMYQDTSRLEYLLKSDTGFQSDPDGVENGQFIYSSRRSTFNMIRPSIGVSFYIPHSRRSTWHEN
jgi:hypothetical protein